MAYRIFSSVFFVVVAVHFFYFFPFCRTVFYLIRRVRRSNENKRCLFYISFICRRRRCCRSASQNCCSHTTLSPCTHTQTHTKYGNELKTRRKRKRRRVKNIGYTHKYICCWWCWERQRDGIEMIRMYSSANALVVYIHSIV